VNDLEVRWRQDRADGRIVRACHHVHATSGDPLMGTQATAEIGGHVVAAHNRSLAWTAWKEGHTAGEFDAGHPDQAPTHNPYDPGWFSPEYLG
jgi:hypothetical protein